MSQPVAQALQGVVQRALRAAGRRWPQVLCQGVGAHGPSAIDHQALQQLMRHVARRGLVCQGLARHRQAEAPEGLQAHRPGPDQAVWLAGRANALGQDGAAHGLRLDPEPKRRGAEPPHRLRRGQRQGQQPGLLHQPKRPTQQHPKPLDLRCIESHRAQAEQGTGGGLGAAWHLLANAGQAALQRDRVGQQLGAAAKAGQRGRGPVAGVGVPCPGIEGLFHGPLRERCRTRTGHFNQGHRARLERQIALRWRLRPTASAGPVRCAQSPLRR